MVLRVIFPAMIVGAMLSPGAAHSSAAAQIIPVPRDQQREAEEEGRGEWKDPEVAKRMAFWYPGGGHLYTGELGRGVTLLTGGAIGTVAVALALFCEASIDFSCQNTGPVAAGGLALMLGTWIYGMVDADNSARRVNRRNGWTSPPRPGPTVSLGRDRVSVGWTLRYR